MNIIRVILDLMNGKKFTTGTIMIIAVFVLEQIGMPKNEATTAASSIMLAVGSVMAIWGYIHRIIKSLPKKGKK